MRADPRSGVFSMKSQGGRTKVMGGERKEKKIGREKERNWRWKESSKTGYAPTNDLPDDRYEKVLDSVITK
jgi:hypothetical protein